MIYHLEYSVKKLETPRMLSKAHRYSGVGERGYSGVGDLSSDSRIATYLEDGCFMKTSVGSEVPSLGA
jgi:2-keto-3-deoxy-L-rhamnonate aldolase RhmA